MGADSADGITTNDNYDRDSIGEFDYTQGSGWMYSINGTLYEGTGMSGYKVRNGITIYVRFTLAYGKDIGGYDSTGGGYGALSSYCGLWTTAATKPWATTSWRRTVWNPPKQRMVTSTIAAPSAMRRKQIFSRPPAAEQSQ